MKSLTHVTIVALKNHARTQLEIPQLLALQGPNGSGKSSFLQALRIGVLGYEPALGKTLAATRQLIQVGRDRADITLTFDDGFSIERRVGKSLDTRVLPPKGERTEKDAETRIAEETGKFLVSFDLAAFLSLSAEKRRGYLLNILPRSAVDLDQGTWRIWLGFDEAEQYIRSAIDKLWTDKVIADQSLLDGLASALQYTSEKVNEAEAARRQQITISEAAEREAEAAVSSSQSADDVVSKLPELQARLATLQRQIGELDEKRQAWEHAAEAARRLQHDVAAAQGALDRASSYLLQLEAQRTALPPVTDNVAQLMEELETAERKSRSQRDAVAYAGEQLSAIRMTIGELERRLDALGEGDTCPACGAEAEVASLRPALQQQHVVALEQQRERQAAAEEARAKQNAFDEKVAELKIRIRTAEERQRQVEKLDADRRVAEAQRDHAAVQLERAKSQGISMPEEPSTEARVELVSAASSVELDIRVAQQALRAAGEGDAARKRADRERGQLELKTARWEALKALYTAQQKLRAHVIQQLVGPVEANANELLTAIDSKKQFQFLFEREQKLDFDFGFTEDGVFRSYDAASTGEDAFLAVVLVAALIAAVAPPWSVLLVDNAESIDDVRRRELMDALARHADRFGNIIMAGCCEFDAAAAWKVVEVQDGSVIRLVAA